MTLTFFDVQDRYYRPVRAFISALVRDEWAADDLVQETFIRVQQRLSDLREEDKVKPWVFQIAHNLCRDYFRGRSRVRSVELDEAPPGLVEFTGQRCLEQDEMSRCVQDKIALLPEGQRAVLVMFDLTQMTHREIAETLGTTVGNVKVRLHRARAALQKILERECQFETDERGVLTCEPVGPGNGRSVPS